MDQCNVIQQQLSEFIDGEITAEDAAVFTSPFGKLSSMPYIPIVNVDDAVRLCAHFFSEGASEA